MTGAGLKAQRLSIQREIIMLTGIEGIGTAGISSEFASGYSVQKAEADKPMAALGQDNAVNISTTASIQANREKSIEAGKLIREAEKVLTQQENILQGMNDNLQAIVKQFPPFLADDPARADYLDGFSGLRKQLESLRVPRQSSTEGVLPKEIRFPSNRNGSEIPNLDAATASDEQVAAVSQKVEMAIAKIASQRDAMSHDVIQSLGGKSYTDMLERFR